MNDFYDSLINKNDDIKEVQEYLIRNYLYNSEEAYRKKICRFHKLFVTLPISTNISDFDNIFEKITGFKIEKFMALGFAFFSYWNQFNYDNLSTVNPFINRSTYFKNSTLSPEDIKIAFRLFCNDIEKCSLLIENQISSSKNWQLEFDVQNNKPLIEIPDVGIAIHGISILQDKITENIYWNILKNLSSHEGDEFLRHFGQIFEIYVFNILQRIFGKKIFKIKYNNDKEAGDCIIEIKRNLFIFEIKSGRLTKETYTTGGINKLIDEYKNKLILRLLKQLSKVISDFKENKFKIGNLTWENVVRIFPVCVTFKEVPQIPTIRDEIENFIKKEKYFDCEKVKQFQIMDVEEIEICETLFSKHFKKSKFSDIMLHKCGNSSFRSSSFKNYIYENTSYSLFNEESDEIRISYDKITERFLDLVFHNYDERKKTLT